MNARRGVSIRKRDGEADGESDGPEAPAEGVDGEGEAGPDDERDEIEPRADLEPGDAAEQVREVVRDQEGRQVLERQAERGRGRDALREAVDHR